jgi:hypothetical protein
MCFSSRKSSGNEESRFTTIFVDFIALDHEAKPSHDFLMTITVSIDEKRDTSPSETVERRIVLLGKCPNGRQFDRYAHIRAEF